MVEAIDLKNAVGKVIVRVARWLPESVYLLFWSYAKRLSIRQRKLLVVLEDYKKLDSDVLRTLARNNGITLYTELQRNDSPQRIEFYRLQVGELLREWNLRGLEADDSYHWLRALQSRTPGEIQNDFRPSFTEMDVDNFETVIRERRSVRNFRRGRISDEVIRKIIDAGRWAPSSSNRQAWKIVVDRNKSDVVSSGNAASKVEADAKIYVLIDERCYSESHASALDAGAMIQNMLLMATALGVGSCWVYQGDNSKQKILCKKFGVPQYLHVYSAVLLGFPEKIYPAPAKKNNIDDVIFLEEEK